MFKPMPGQVLVERLVEDKLGEGILFKAETSFQKSVKCKVLAVGKGKRLSKGKYATVDYAKGDIVLVQTWSGTAINQFDENTLMVQQELVEGVFNE